MPGLDGMRALAVVAVLLYHAGLAWIPGGFLGVEVFFVISGYLITALLVTEWRQRGRIDLAAFWMRRARRLLPALYLVVAATLAYAVVFLPGEVAGLRGDALSAFGYVTNWYLIFGNESYFEAMGRPSLLRHLWSLAVEEQFYLPSG
jgi:peptidoglycan/LPS O-acetylase OafA/YrhL